MIPEHLLYPAIFIFSMMVVGLVLTVIEFRKMMEKSDRDEAEARNNLDSQNRARESASEDK